MKSGVYRITNKINGKFYIGSSKDIDDRWVCHKRNLNNNDHANPILQSAWNKYGSNAFILEIIEEVNPIPKLLFEKEEYYFKSLNPFENGYNIEISAKGGDTFTKNPNKEKIRLKIRKCTKGERNGMFGKHHSMNTIRKQKQKSIGRYTLLWFIERYGEEGNLKYEERRRMLMNRKINYATTPAPSMSFKGKKHKKNFRSHYNRTKTYFRNHWKDFVELIKPKKYSQRQLSTMLGISRPTLKVKMDKIQSSKNA